MVSWYLIERACFSLISAVSRSPTMTDQRQLLASRLGRIPCQHRDPGPAVTILTPAALTLRHAPVADCARYDNLRRTI